MSLRLGVLDKAASSLPARMLPRRASAASIIQFIKGIEPSGGLTLSRIPFHQASERVAIKGTRCYVTDQYYQLESRIDC